MEPTFTHTPSSLAMLSSVLQTPSTSGPLSLLFPLPVPPPMHAQFIYFAWIYRDCLGCKKQKQNLANLRNIKKRW